MNNQKIKQPKPIGGILLFFTLILFDLQYNILDFYDIMILGFILVVGIYDDLFVLKPFEKLVCQIIIFIPIAFGYYEYLNYSIFILLVIFFNYLLLLNSANTIDGLDGLLGIISIISLFLLNVKLNSILIIIVIAALLIITIFNLPPAKIYFGDSGAFLVGSILFKIMLDSYDFNTIEFILFPILFFSLPVVDFFYSILRRALNKKNIFLRDDYHIHHNLMNVTGSKWKSLLILTLIHLVLLFLLSLIFKSHN